ncbi:hypothetical protein Tco_0311389 [Tanacetum coccineum]
MAGPETITLLNEGTSNQNTTKSIIEGHVSALNELLKEQSNRDLIKHMLLDFDDIWDVSDEEIKVNKKGKAKVGDEDLSKPFKEVLKCPFTRRIVEFSSPGHRMPTNAKYMMDEGSGEDQACSGSMILKGISREISKQVWAKLKARAKDSTENSKIVRRGQETLPKFKERAVETLFEKHTLEGRRDVKEGG